MSMTNRTYLVVTSRITIIQSEAPFQILWHKINSYCNLHDLPKRFRSTAMSI